MVGIRTLAMLAFCLLLAAPMASAAPSLDVENHGENGRFGGCYQGTGAWVVTYDESGVSYNGVWIAQFGFGASAEKC